MTNTPQTFTEAAAAVDVLKDMTAKALKQLLTVNAKAQRNKPKNMRGANITPEVVSARQSYESIREIYREMRLLKGRLGTQEHNFRSDWSIAAETVLPPDQYQSVFSEVCRMRDARKAVLVEYPEVSRG